MGLPWARLDANIAQHDKIVWLKSQRGGWRAISVYLFSIGWSAGQGTDGYIPDHMAPALDADKRTVELLTVARMWEPGLGGWQIRNYHERQELDTIATAKRMAQKVGGSKGACQRWHGPNCNCWREATLDPMGNPIGRANG